MSTCFVILVDNTFFALKSVGQIRKGENHQSCASPGFPPCNPLSRARRKQEAYVKSELCGRAVDLYKITSKTNRIYIRKYKTLLTVQHLHCYEQKSPSAMDLGHIHDKTPRRTMAPKQLQNLHHSPTTRNNISFFTMMHKPPVISRSPCMT